MNNIILKKYNSIDNCLLCHLNNDTDNLRLFFAEIYNNGYNANYFNIYSDGSLGGFDKNICETKYNYILNNLDFYGNLQKLTEFYSGMIINYKIANYYIINNKKESDNFITYMNKVSDYKYLIEALKVCKFNNLPKNKKSIYTELLNQLKSIEKEVKDKNLIYGYYK